LPLYDFFELYTLVALKCNEIGRPLLINQTVWEEVGLVSILSKKGAVLTKYIVNIGGMTYIADIDKVTLAIYDLPIRPIVGNGVWIRYKYGAKS
jgi:hypothetical protein